MTIKRKDKEGAMKVFARGCTMLGLVLMVFLMVGCSSSDKTTPAATSFLDGYVSAKSDVAGAGIQVIDADGKVIAEKQAPATSDAGAFMITVSDLPDRFRVVSTGGTNSEQSVDYSLKAQFEGFDPEKDIIYVDLATTLVCAWLDRNPDKGLAEATAAVKAFLDIPEHVELGEGLHHTDSYFSPKTFLEEAANNGGVEAFMGSLLDEMAQDPEAKHSFPPAPGLQVIQTGELVKTCGGTTMLQAARNGVIAWGVGFALNVGMEALFPSEGGPTKADINEMKDMLKQNQSQITELKNMVAAGMTELKTGC